MAFVRTSSLLSILALIGAAATAHGQCPTTWASGSPQPHLSGNTECSTQWDPDGAGPLPVRLVVGGLSLIGGQAEGRVLSWDGSTWQAIGGKGPGTGYNGPVTSLVDWNGSLVASGYFNGGGTDYMALWTGTAWQGLGTGAPLPAATLAVWNGMLVAASQAAGVPTIRLWNGATWTVLPPPPSLQWPLAAISYQGLLCVCGSKGSPTQGVLERWNGTSWLPSILAQHTINALAVRTPQVFGAAEVLYVGGRFTSIGGVAAARVAATSGGTAFAWSPIGSGLTEECTRLHARNSGVSGFTLVGSFDSTTAPTRRFTSGGAWTNMGSYQLTSLNYFGGSYHGTSSATNGESCVRWDGAAWVGVRGPGIAGEVHAVTPYGDDMVVGGTFVSISGMAANGVARWDGTTFHALGSGIAGLGSVDALLTLAGGDVVAGGSFAGPTGNGISRWNGTSWSGLGLGLNGPVRALVQLPDGDLVAGGTFTTAGGVPCARIARWDGSSWSQVGSGMDSDVNALAVLDDGRLVAAGAFTSAGGNICHRIAQWNGAAWIQFGQGTNGTVEALAVRPNGDIVVVGSFTSAGGLPAARCARWTGASWAPMGAVGTDPTTPRAVVALPDGDVIAGRGFHQPATSTDAGISRWDGASWASVAGGLCADFQPLPVTVRALAMRADGALVVGGTFAMAGGTFTSGTGIAANGLATLSSTCLPTAAPYGTGCSSAAGTLAITADTLPWIGAMFRTTTTGVASGSLCLGVIGLSQLSIPLAALLAEGQPGCSLLASPDILMLSLPDASNEVHSTFAIGDDPSLIGVPFYQQTIPFETDGSGSIVAIRGSNALALTIGAL